MLHLLLPFNFIELAKNKLNTTIVQWMSEAGAEYKSKAFEKMLKDRGIEILQSIPYAHQQNEPAFLNLGGNSWLNTLCMYKTGCLYVAIIGRPHTSSCMVIGHH